MPLSLPELISPLGGIAACANRIALSEYPELCDLIPQQKTEHIALADDGRRCVRLVRERFSEDRCHFHLDVYSREILTAKFAPNCELSEISNAFDALIGKTLLVNFESKFRLTTSTLPKVGLVNLLGSVGINIGGTTASLAGASIRLSDSIFREVRWKHIEPTVDGSPQYSVEILGTLGQTPISAELLPTVALRAMDGLNRFVLFKSGAKVPRI